MNIVFQTRTSDSVTTDSDSESHFLTTVYLLESGEFFLLIHYRSGFDKKFDFFLNGGQMFDSLAKAKDAATMQIMDFLSVEVAP